MEVISFRNTAEGGTTELYANVKALVSHNPNLKCYTRYGEEDVTEEWIESELDANAVASVHKTDRWEFAGVVREENFSYVISRWAVINR